MKFIEVPHYDELSVKSLWPQFAEDEEVARYFLDDFSKDKRPSREYFFNIVNTIQPDYLKTKLVYYFFDSLSNSF